MSELTEMETKVREANERERFTEWYDGLKKKRMGLFSRHCAGTAWQARARIAEQEKAELVEALRETIEVAEHFIHQQFQSIQVIHGQPIGEQDYWSWHERGPVRLRTPKETLAKHEQEKS